MKKFFTLVFVVCTQVAVFAQQQPQSFHLDRQLNMAAILNTRPSLQMGFSTISEARSIIADIMAAVDQQQNFKVVSTTQIDNAAAVIYNGQRYILYNPSFINQLDDAANDRWASISVVAHEIGHHLLGHTLDGRGSQIPKELAADEFSGAALRRMGASLQQAQLAMQLVANPVASATHPAEKDRLLAIQNGWNSANANAVRNRDVATSYPNAGSGYPAQGGSANSGSYPNPEAGRTRQPQPASQQKYPQRGRQAGPASNYPAQRNSGAQTIAYDVVFTSANNAMFYITSQNNVVKYNGRQYISVARLARTNSNMYPYVLYDDQVQLLLDKRGNLRTEAGRVVGFIRQH